MLVLSRKVGQKIIIGEPGNTITLIVMEIRGDKVRLAMTAPKEVPIHRQEVYNRIHQEQQQPGP